MKIRKNYVLVINSYLKKAFYGGRNFNARLERYEEEGNEFIFVKIFDCNFVELMSNLKTLNRNGYSILKH